MLLLEELELMLHAVTNPLRLVLEPGRIQNGSTSLLPRPVIWLLIALEEVTPRIVVVVVVVSLVPDVLEVQLSLTAVQLLGSVLALLELEIMVFRLTATISRRKRWMRPRLRAITIMAALPVPTRPKRLITLQDTLGLTPFAGLLVTTSFVPPISVCVSVISRRLLFDSLAGRPSVPDVSFIRSSTQGMCPSILPLPVLT